MARIYVIHGYGGRANEGWRPWLKRELEARGQSVTLLEMPDTESPQLDAWVTHLRDAVGPKTDDVILVGHSLGCPTILRFLESMTEGHIRGAVLVAGFYEDLGPRFAEIAHFVVPPIDMARANTHCNSFAVLHAPDDQTVPLPFAERLASALGVDPILTPGRGHYSGSNGITGAEEISEAVMEMAS